MPYKSFIHTVIRFYIFSRKCVFYAVCNYNLQLWFVSVSPSYNSNHLFEFLTAYVYSLLMFCNKKTDLII